MEEEERGGQDKRGVEGKRKGIKHEMNTILVNLNRNEIMQHRATCKKREKQNLFKVYTHKGHLLVAKQQKKLNMHFGKRSMTS